MSEQTDPNGPPLPPGWCWTTLGQCSEFLQYGSSAKTNKDATGVPVLRMGNIRQDGSLGLDDLKYLPAKHDEFPGLLLKSGDILFNRTNSAELVGKTGVYRDVPAPCSFASYLIRVRLHEGVLPTLVSAVVNSGHGRRWIKSVASQTVGQANVNGTKLAAFEFPLPPFNEQQRIVDLLDELFSDLDAGVAGIERVLAKLGQYRAAVLKAAVEGALSADWRAKHRKVEPASALLTRILAERRRRWEEDQLRKFKEADKAPPKNWKAKYQEPVAPDTASLPPLPEGWCWATADQLSLMVTSGSRGWADFYTESGPIFVRSQDIRTDHLLLADVAHVRPPKNSEGARTHLCCGDFLITITGANVAKAALVDVELGEAYVSQHVGLVRLVQKDLGKFIHVYVTAPTGGRRQLLQTAYGAGKPGLNLDNLRELPIPLPPSAEHQALVEAVEDQLSVVDHLESDLAAKLKSAQALRQSILRHAFTGQLVPQDPKDEPAAELLKRIATEREARARQALAAKRAAKPKASSAGKSAIRNPQSAIA